MQTLSIDIETYSSVSLKDSGVYRYAEAKDFKILLFAYSVDEGPVAVIDLENGESIPKEVIEALTDERVIKRAFNANFERICLSRFLGYETGRYISPVSWHCTMVHAATLGLPQTLEGVGAVLKLDKQKLKEGKELLRLFSVPQKESNNSRRESKWEAFKRYNKRDVEVEMEIERKLSLFPVSSAIWEEYTIDQEINDRGVLLDMELVHEAIKLDEINRKELIKKLKDLTGLENPNSVMQMKEWLKSNGVNVSSLDKKTVKAMLEKEDADEPGDNELGDERSDDELFEDVFGDNETGAELLENEAVKASDFSQVVNALKLWSQLAKTSVRKYQAMEKAVCSDGRARGTFRFYGANRTGRFSGKLIQLQNLPQNHLENLEEVRALVKNGEKNAVKNGTQNCEEIQNVSDVLSQLIRTAFIAKDKLVVSDFSAIEARVIAWYAGEKWREKVFASGGDIYSASASRMFGVKVEKHGVNAHLRQKGKIAELALGYGGSVGALKAMGALEMGLEEDELYSLVVSWREANKNIVNFWKRADEAVLETVKYHYKTSVNNLSFFYKSGILFIALPSGRKLAYVRPKLGINKFGNECVTYEGIGPTKHWERIESYGPKFVENIVQATARDILCFAMKTLSDKNIVMHIHDELVIDGGIELDEVIKLMSITPPWAKGLLLSADGYETEFYKKD